MIKFNSLEGLKILHDNNIPISCEKKEIYLTMNEVEENKCYDCPRVELYKLLEKDRRT